MMPSIAIRKASEDDAEGMRGILVEIAEEGVHSAIDAPWTVEQERAYLRSLSEREAIQVALAGDQLVGFQSLDLWSAALTTMAHVGQLGTFVVPGHRGQGIGRALFRATVAFAHAADYEKFVIQVRASNTLAQRFYRGLGFAPAGRFTRQVRIGSAYDDEVLMELFLDPESDSGR